MLCPCTLNVQANIIWSLHGLKQLPILKKKKNPSEKQLKWRKAFVSLPVQCGTCQLTPWNPVLGCDPTLNVPPPRKPVWASE